jgi:hypothetical protein
MIGYKREEEPAATWEVGKVGLDWFWNGGLVWGLEWGGRDGMCLLRMCLLGRAVMGWHLLCC